MQLSDPQICRRTLLLQLPQWSSSVLMSTQSVPQRTTPGIHRHSPGGASKQPWFIPHSCAHSSDIVVAPTVVSAVVLSDVVVVDVAVKIVVEVGSGSVTTVSKVPTVASVVVVVAFVAVTVVP